jgi:serine protease Do
MALTTRMAQELGAPDTRGALIYQMGRNTPAYQAGLRPGDIITSFNGQRIDDPSQFVRLLADAPIGSTARVTALREGRELEVEVRVTAAERPGR